jgi:uncharacterized membrane protein HdeD (DUF308 family)
MEIRQYRYWWLLASKGIFTFFFGIITLLSSEVSVVSVLLLFGLLLLFSGNSLIIGAFTQREQNIDWSLWFIEGVIDIIFGVIIFIFPIQTSKIFFLYISVWIISMGSLRIFVFLQLPFIRLFSLLAVGISLITGIFLLVYAFPTIKSGLLTIGGYSVVFGITVVVSASKLRAVTKQYGAY